MAPKTVVDSWCHANTRNHTLFGNCSILALLTRRYLYLELVVKSIFILDICAGKVCFCFLVDVLFPDLTLLAAFSLYPSPLGFAWRDFWVGT